MPMERSMVKVSNGGSLVNKISYEVQKLIAIMLGNSQQFGICNNPQGNVNEVSTIPNLKVKVNNIAALVQQIASRQVRACGICY